MLRPTLPALSRRFRYSLKYPALVSYNKLPWETLNHETPQLHMHVAPHYEQILTLAAAAPVPRLVVPAHISPPADTRLRVLPGTLYILSGSAPPEGFAVSRVVDPAALQYYGPLAARVAPVATVRLLVAEDLRLLCNCVTLRGPLRLPIAPHASLAAVAEEEFTLFHYFRPNRPPRELRMERYYVHVPRAGAVAEFDSAWEPRLQAPKRSASTRVTPLPAYRPPQSYLMGLAERLGVVPGSAFGRRSLMWGHWF